MPGESIRIESICGTWDYKRNDHEENHIGKGYIVRKKNSWFEGFIKEVNQKTGQSRLDFIFGIYFNNTMELFYCQEHFISRFHCEKEQRSSFTGTLSNIDFPIEVPVGTCKFNITSVKLEEQEDIINKVKLARNGMNYISKEFYVKLFDNMDRLYLGLSRYHDSVSLLDILNFSGKKEARADKDRLEKMKPF